MKWRCKPAIPSTLSQPSPESRAADDFAKAGQIRHNAVVILRAGQRHAEADAALVESIRNERMPDSPLKGSANILVMPNMEAARISYNLLRVSSSEGVTVGPVLMGVAKPVHILTPIASVRRIVNMVALAVVEAQTQPL